MTDKSPETPAAPAPAGDTPAASTTSGNLSSISSKALWAGVGIGSAAIIAAVMYARRPKTKK